MSNEAIAKNVALQHDFFASGKTKDINFRIQQLYNLKHAIIKYEQQIIDALHQDLNKPDFQAFSSEIYICLKEINTALKNIRCWTKPNKVPTPWYLFQSSSFIIYEPLGTVLIIAPWNYPFQLNIMPLIGAMISGNCVTIKPSEFAPNTANIISELIKNTFDKSYINVVLGDGGIAQELLDQKFDYIFFTGSTKIGKIVMQAAAKNLTPLTLELGGKNPCIVDRNISIYKTSKRIVLGKFSNAGQSCIAPDYLFVHETIKDELIEKLYYYIDQFYGKDPSQNPDYPKIISTKHYDRLIDLLNNSKVISNIKHDRNKLCIAPTIIELKPDDKNHILMQDEIFGPILVIISYNDLDQVINYINSRPKPLALYCFSNNKAIQQKILSSTSSGGTCINNISMQFANLNLPFGGVGSSGFGRYHGKSSFLTFSNPKSVVNNSLRFDLPIWYPPYKTKFFSLIKKFLSWSNK